MFEIELDVSSHRVSSESTRQEHGRADGAGTQAVIVADRRAPCSGLPPLMLVAGILEVVGGIAIMLGLFTRPVAFLLSGEMAVAYFMAHVPNGPMPLQNHGEPAVLFAFIFLFLAGNGSGGFSIDSVLRRGRAPLAQPAR